METTVLGSTGQKVSRLGFGGAPAGLKDYVHRFDPLDPKQADGVVAAIRRAYDLGITYFDTAAGYGDGTGERLFGEGLSGIAPESVFLATKCAPCSGSEMRRSFERSLRMLKRERVDLLQVHGSVADDQIEMVLEPGGMLDGIEKLREEGLVTHVGFTTEAQNRALYRFLDTGRFEVMQTEYNLLFQHPFDPHFQTGAMLEARERGMGIVTMRSLTSGIFTRWMKAVRPGDNFDYHPALLQFCLSNPLIDVVLVGMRTVDEVERNVAVANDVSGRIDLDAVHKHYPAE